MNPVARLVPSEEHNPRVLQVRELLGLGGLAQLFASSSQAGVEGVGAAGGRVAGGSPEGAMFSSQRPSACRAKAVSQGRQRGEAAEQPGDRVSSSRGSHICLICLDAVEQLGLLVCDCTLRFIVEQHVHQHQETSSRPPDSGSTSRAASAIAHKLSFAQKPSFGPQRRATAAQRRSTAGQGPRSSRAAGAAAAQPCPR